MSTTEGGVLAELQSDELTLLMAIGSQPHPVGARMASRTLEERGVKISEASVSRMLGKLDDLGLTRPIGRKGRELTDSGLDVYRSRKDQARRDETFDRALEMRSITELLDWLRARRAIEGEAAFLAASRATAGDLAALSESVEVHELAARTGDLGFRTVGMQFHMLLARASDSPVFEALVESLTSSRVEAIENALDLIMSTHGTMGDSAPEHRRLLNAIAAGQAEAARDLMHAHLERLAHEVALFADQSDGVALLNTLSAIGVRVPGAVH